MCLTWHSGKSCAATFLAADARPFSRRVPQPPDGTEGPEAKGGGPGRAEPASAPRPAPPDGGAMPELVVTALLAPSRLALRLLRAALWGAVFSAALLAAAAYGCTALAHVLCRPRRGCCGRPRRAPPACLSDPALGQHGFLTLKVSGRAGPERVGPRANKRSEPNLRLGRHEAGVIHAWGAGGPPGLRLVPSTRAPAYACTMSPRDVATDPSCCFCTASLRTGMTEALGPEGRGMGGGGAWTSAAPRRPDGC